jgi:hypothetical protein
LGKTNLKEILIMTVMRLVKDDQDVTITAKGINQALEHLNNEVQERVNYSGSYNFSTVELKTLLEKKVISIDAYIWFCLKMGNTKNESIMDVDLDDFIAEHQVYAGKNDDPVLDRNKVLSSILVLDKKKAFQLQPITSVQLCLF